MITIGVAMMKFWFILSVYSSHILTYFDFVKYCWINSVDPDRKLSVWVILISTVDLSFKMKYN